MTLIPQDDRGQLHTIEATAAAIIMILVLAVVVQTTSLTPLSSSFTSQHVKLELKNMGNDILTTLDETPIYKDDPTAPSLLKESIIDWSVYHHYDVYAWTNKEFLSQKNLDGSKMNTALTNALKFGLIDKGISFNVEVAYSDKNNVARTAKMIWNGDPSENSVTATRFVILNDGSNEIPSDPSDPDRFDNNRIIPDISPTSLHNVVEVRLTLWVM